MTEKPMPFYFYLLFVLGAWIYAWGKQLQIEEGTPWGWSLWVGIVGLVIILFTGQHAFHKGQRIGFGAKTSSRT